MTGDNAKKGEDQLILPLLYPQFLRRSWPRRDVRLPFSPPTAYFVL